MHTGLRAAIVVAGVASAATPVVAFFSLAGQIDGSIALVALAGFAFLLAPHVPVILTARYEPVSRGRLFGLLACEAMFGLVPTTALGFFTQSGAGGLAFALLFFSGAVLLWIVQFVVFASAARVARGGTPRHTPAYLRWV